MASADEEARFKNRTQQSPLASQRAKQAKADRQEAKRTSIFPLGYRDTFYQWWTSVPAAVAEHNVLSFLPYLQAPPTQSKTNAPVSKPAADGSVAGASAEDLKETPSASVQSERDPYGPRRWHSDLVKLSGKDRAGKVREAEDWFVDSLEEWRKARKLERFTLLGHSLGGYMAVAYALKYPDRLHKLILASPVGIPEDPYAVSADLPEPPDSTLAAEFAQDQAADSTTPAAPPRADNNNFLNARTKAEAAAAAAAKDGPPTNDNSPAPRKPLPKWLTYLWDANISPFSLVRWSGPLGPRFVSGWTSRRFSHLPPQEAQALHTYAYALFRLRGSGEYALAYVLAPGAFARSPLIRRIGGVGRQPVAPGRATTTEGALEGPAAESKEGPRETGLPVVLVYGENDWMDVAGGYAAKEKLDEARAAALETATAEEARRERGSARVVVVKNAGHHVYLDGWKDFNEEMLKEMRDVSEAAEKNRRPNKAESGS